jgi:hypothetical protein
MWLSNSTNYVTSVRNGSSTLLKNIVSFPATSSLVCTLFNYYVNRVYKGVSKSFRTESIKKYTLTFGVTRWEATKKVMAAKLTSLTHRIAIQLHLVAVSCTSCSSSSRRPVRELLGTPPFDYLSRLERLRVVISESWTRLIINKLINDTERN